ncbi:MAG: diacylglycerol kinase family lipid kinase [Cyclobacteriaceae bacterium]|nr:diacylglycerol kinase family lipid kinase [Cyclobacteriaceae bacterium]
MTVAIILNGVCKKKKFFYQRILPGLQKEFAVTVFETTYAGHATELARAAAGFTVVIAAGGDGTLNQVLNGLLTATGNSLPALGLIPLGSGNDFAGAANLTTSAADLITLLRNNAPQRTDVGLITCVDRDANPIQHYFINACSVGMGPAVVQQMARAPKWLGAGLRYLLATVKIFFAHEPIPVEVKTDQNFWKGDARVVAVANGKSFGKKLYIAPDADLNDGYFNTFLVGVVAVPVFLSRLLLLKRGKKIAHPAVVYSKSRQVTLRAPRPTPLEAEGELVGFLPAEIEICSEKILFLR